MDDTLRRSTAGPRQFENTAVAKLVARGVPKHVAEAFVRIGLPKSGRVDALKNTVCKMQYKKFFVESTMADFKDPLRVGAYTPHVVESKETKFHCEFQMTDIESAKFAKLFPEFDVVARGRTYNQHAFYANKRYAEAEILVGMVHRDSRISGLDPRSIVDLGGNDAWHVKRGREHVHCDNPLLSARDKMRYEVRQIFSGSDRSSVCNKKFSVCTEKFDYAIAVHSTYDMSPKDIAMAMHKRGIKKFFGVVNYIPGIESKPEGVYEVDGLEMEVKRPTRGSASFSCGFKHDPSLRYQHKLTVLKKYLTCQQQYDCVNSDGSASSFTYCVRSVRGNTVVFSIDNQSRGSNINTSTWADTINKSYRISLNSLGVSDMEVDCEFFDRLVLQAASARNISQFDIVSLFRYAKSLRQRVSINGIVLSSGFTFNPDELVHSTIAAYAVALAYRNESTSFFKKASSQIINHRSQGVFRDIVAVTAKSLEIAVLAIPVAFSRVSGLSRLDQRIKDLIRTNTAVKVEIIKPNLGKGIRYEPTLFTKRFVLTRLKTLRAEGLPVTPYSKYYGATLLPTRVLFGGTDTTFFSRGMVAYDSYEIPRSTNSLKIYNLGTFSLGPDRSVEKIRELQYSEMFNTLRLVKNADRQSLVMPNGDRMYRLSLTSVLGERVMQREDLSFSSNTVPYVIFRGVGQYVVSLRPPKKYIDGCIGFYLFFESRVDSLKLVRPVTVESEQDTHVDVLSIAESSPSLGTTHHDDGPGWDVVSDRPTGGLGTLDVRAFTTEREGVELVEQGIRSGSYFMSGALTQDPLVTPPAEDAELVRDAVASTMGASDIPPDGEDVYVTADNQTVSSSDVVVGKNSMEEYLHVADLVSKAAIAGAKQVLDIARSAASGDAPKAYFKTAAGQLPGNLRAVKVSYDSGTPTVVDVFDDSECDHMAVSDGITLLDLWNQPPPPGVYVTSDALLVYTGGKISQSVKEAMEISFDCPVTCVDGIAGSGKTYHIVNHAQPGDLVLCETRAALKDTAADLHKVKGWRGHAYTVDAFLMHRQLESCETLWVDEAFRLHAGKLFALTKLLKPKAMYCFGDSKQIPALSFVPMYDFIYDKFPFTKIQPKRDSWRFGADVCFALSQSQFYGYHATTHVPILRSFQAPRAFQQGCLHGREKGVVLVYTHTARDDLRNQGVRDVMTIGESQGKTFDHVIVFRDTTLNKALYFDNFQALVAVTRHRKTCTYVTVVVPEIDESSVAKLFRYASEKSNEILLASHVVRGVKPARDYLALESRPAAPRSGASARSASPPGQASISSGWEVYSDED